MVVVLDPIVLVTAALSPTGPPADLIRRWPAGEFELLISPMLLAELRRVMAYQKISKRIPPADAAALASLLLDQAQLAPDPGDRPPIQIEDPDDEYLVALAFAHGAALVAGDKHLTVHAGQLPILTPAEFLGKLEQEPPTA